MVNKLNISPLDDKYLQYPFEKYISHSGRLKSVLAFLNGELTFYEEEMAIAPKAALDTIYANCKNILKYYMVHLPKSQGELADTTGFLNSMDLLDNAYNNYITYYFN